MAAMTTISARVFRRRQISGGMRRVLQMMMLILVLVDLACSWTCPSDCLCLSSTQILCNSGHLTFVPLRDLPKSTEYLSLTKNNLTYLPTDAFTGLRYLRKLTLDGNSIHDVEQFAFRGLPRLRELSIQYTPLSSLKQYSFSGLQNVTVILLGYNQIGWIDQRAFAGTTNIRLILLNNNPLHKIYANAFSGLTNVEHLILPSGIRELDQDSFNGLESVGLLRLSFMDLTALRPYTFRGLKHVHVLAIQDSDLGVIRSDVFAGLKGVGSLNIQNNKIDSVQSLMVTTENRVKHVQFNGNHVLDSPRRGAFAVVVSESFTVMGNHFPCDCHLFQFLDGRPFGNDTSVETFISKNYCISPLELNGQPVGVVKQSFVKKCLQTSSAHATAPTPPSTVRMFLIIVAILFLLVRRNERIL